MAALGCGLNGSTQHALEIEHPGRRARRFCRRVVRAGAASVADGRTDISKCRFAMEPRQNRRSGCQLGKVASIFIGKRSVTHLNFSYSSDSKAFLRDNGFPTKCCVDRLKSQPIAALQTNYTRTAAIERKADVRSFRITSQSQSAFGQNRTFDLA